MLRFLLSILLIVAILAGLVALIVLGESWLLLRLFPLELWQMALVVLGSVGILAYVAVQILVAVGASPFPLQGLDWDDDEDDDEDEEDYIGPPPWRRSPPSSNRRKRSR